MAHDTAGASAQKGGKSPLNGMFHYVERKSSLGRELAAGAVVAILSVCGMFVNMQLMAKTLVTGPYSTASVTEVISNGEVYAQLYFVSMLVAFAGSLVMGLVAKLPLVQVSSLGLGTVLISIAGSFNGLSYYNLLAISFVSSVVCTVLSAVPQLWRFVASALPEPVRRALPAAAGLLLAWVAMQLTGLVSVGASSVSTYGAGAVLEEASDSVQLSGLVGLGGFSYSTDKFHPLMEVCAVSVLLTFAAFLFFTGRSSHPYLLALLTGTVAFLLGNILFVCISWKNFGMTLDSLWGRLWTVGGEDAMQYHLGKVLTQLSFGKVLSEGFDFGTYVENGGNVALLMVTGVLTVCLTNLLDVGASLGAVASASVPVDEGSVRRAVLLNSAFGVVAPLVGGISPSIGKESYAGARDGGRTGLTSVAASVVFLVSAFVWVVPFFFVTLFSYDIKFTMYGHYGETLQALAECSFAIADAVMAIAGVSMAVRSLDFGQKDGRELAAFAVTVASTVFASSLAFGACAGTVAYLLVPKGKGEKPTLANVVCGAVSVAFLVLALFTA